MKSKTEVKSKEAQAELLRGSVLKQLAVLSKMSLEQLREKWLELFGGEPPFYKSQFMIKRLAYRIQELYYGGLSETAKAALKNFAASDPVATANLSIPEQKSGADRILPGTRFVRIWNGKRYEVITGNDGFEFQGRTFRSLSAIAREITGTRWNGKLFFGLRNSPNAEVHHES
jgi:hypothetical protein